MTLLGEFMRVSRRHPCPVCARPDWCLVSRDDPAAPTQAICARVESGTRWGEAGWLHQLRDTDHRGEGRRTRVVPLRAGAAEFGGLARTLQAGLDTDALHAYATDLGLPSSSLLAFGIGMAQRDEVAELGLRWARRAWTFPMHDAHGRVVGIRVRLPGGKKLCVPGSRLGLVVPDDLADAGGEVLVVAEGESDAAALHAIGLPVVGRPGCRACARVLAEFVRRERFARILVAADADEAGLAGAEALAQHLVAVAPSVQVLAPPAEHRDVREWVVSGARSEDLIGAARCLPPRSIAIRSRRRTR